MARRGPALEGRALGLGQAHRGATADKRTEFERRMRGDLPGALNAAVRAVKESLHRSRRKSPPASPASSRWRASSRRCGDDRRLGRSHRLQQHPHQSMKAMSSSDYSGRFIHYGIREHAWPRMTA